MSSGMIALRRVLVERHGEYGLHELVQMCQERGLNPVEDVPTKEMWNKVMR